MRLTHVVAGALLAAAPALAEDHCTLNAVIGGKKVAMKSCAAAVMDNAGLTLFFTETPIAADERAAFEMNSYAKDTKPDGSARTLLYLAFCPGGGKPEASAAAVKSVEMGINHASSVLLSRQWVFEVPGDGVLKIEKLEGTLAAGGRVSGHITGGKTSDGLAYSWDATFDVAVPETNALAGPGCGS